LFSQNQQRGRFGQGLLLACQFPLQILDPLFLFLRRLTQTRRAGAVPVIGLLTSCAPSCDLRRIKPALAAVFSQIGFIQRRCFQNRRELVARRPAFGAGLSVG
ncbi:MAG: hypothetical protein L0H65_17290, partial [Pseudorhodobacter sp.]|nr:hypothetical protein [Pseudorhodobacter sp.]